MLGVKKKKLTLEQWLWYLLIGIVAAIPVYYFVGNFFIRFWLYHVGGIS